MLSDRVELHVEQVIEREISVGVDQTVELCHDLLQGFALKFAVVGQPIVPQVQKFITILVNFLNFSFPSDLVYGQHLESSK